MCYANLLSHKRVSVALQATVETYNTQGPRTLNIIVFTFFYNINKGDLPLMYSRVFWCEFIDLVVFFFRIMKKVTGVTQQRPKATHQTTQEYIKGRSPLFIL